MQPAEVLFDRELTHRDRHVYAVMAYYRDGATVRVGERRLAGACGINRRDLRDIREKLAVRGHLKRETEFGTRNRGSYSLLAPCFKRKDDATETVPTEAPPVPVKSELVRCPKCETRCKQILKVGWCRRCNTNKNIEKISERVTRRVLREEVGAERTA